MARRHSAIPHPHRLTDDAAPAQQPVGVSLLADLRRGHRATVVRVADDAHPATARRLEDLGFTTGTEVEVVRRAPLRDPVVYRVKDYELCLRRAQAQCVLIQEIA
ncbi:ferrous iron transport protein A [Micromonospora sp. NPDC093277]|uniref:FeoA family protein n=1 Tax=Micromonospora sp. NPDC093277 TaxID=3364291 RepID=UPI0037F8557E